MAEEKYKNPSVTVDAIIFTIKDNKLNTLLIKRKNPPFKDSWAFPGGFVDYEEDIDLAAPRELQEETGIANVELHQFHTFGNPNRDPRRRTISVAYYTIAKYETLKVKAADDAKDAQFFEINNLPTLAFDHKLILETALNTMQKDLETHTTAKTLLAKEFSAEILYKTYQVLLNQKINKEKLVLELSKNNVIQQIFNDKYQFAAQNKTLSCKFI